jgi:hypothetical protein
MRLMTRLLFCAVLLALPSTAQAQLQVSPFAGVTFGGDTTTSSGTAGVSANWWMLNWLGIEAEASSTPYLFGQDGFLTSRSLTTFTGSLIARLPMMGSDRFQPFVVAGLGTIRPNLAEAGELSVVKGDTLALNVGVGAMGFVSDHVGFRADLRYLRGLRESDLDTNGFGVDFSKFALWRTTAGIVVRF